VASSQSAAPTPPPLSHFPGTARMALFASRLVDGDGPIVLSRIWISAREASEGDQRNPCWPARNACGGVKNKRTRPSRRVSSRSSRPTLSRLAPTGSRYISPRVSSHSFSSALFFLSLTLSAFGSVIRLLVERLERCVPLFCHWEPWLSGWELPSTIPIAYVFFHGDASLATGQANSLQEPR